jgi:hypothetical protein
MSIAHNLERGREPGNGNPGTGTREPGNGNPGTGTRDLYYMAYSGVNITSLEDLKSKGLYPLNVYDYAYEDSDNTLVLKKDAVSLLLFALVIDRRKV